MKFISVLFIFAVGFSHAVSAAPAGERPPPGCPDKIEGNKLLITFNGLAGVGNSNQHLTDNLTVIPLNSEAGTLGANGRILTKKVVAPKNKPQFSAAKYSSGQSSAAIKCIRYWKEKDPNINVVMFGHSCGGVAALDTAKELSSGSNPVQIDSVMTLDPVCGANALQCAENIPAPTFQKPANIKNLVNFYQCGGGLMGKKIDGGLNCKVTSAHTLMPQRGFVKDTAIQLLSGNYNHKPACPDSTAFQPTNAVNSNGTGFGLRPSGPANNAERVPAHEGKCSIINGQTYCD